MACILRSGVREWNNGVLPYTVGSGFSTATLGRIAAAIAHWNDETDWQLVPRTNHSSYVNFRIGDICSSPLGRQGGRQSINLANNCSFGSIVHEIGHAIGFAHEQNRQDRNNHVVVMLDRVRSDKRHNFSRVSGENYRDVGDYDYGSIMHYPRDGFLRSKRHDWSSGWTSAKAFRAGDLSYLFLLKESDGLAHIHRLDREVGVGHEVARHDWSAGWSTVEFFENSGVTFLFLLKRSNGTVHIHAMDADGTVGARVHTADWSAGWTTAEFWRSGANVYLFLLKKGNGLVHVHRMNNDGSVGAMVDDRDWSNGWSTAKVFQVDGQNYLFLLKESNGTVHIHALNNDGTIGDLLHDYDWSSGWSDASVYVRNDKTYLFLLKESNGIIHAHRMNDDGSVGTRVDDRDWSSGWTSAETYQIDGINFLFLLKESSGIVHLHRMRGTGAIGDELRLTPAINLFAPAAIGQRTGLSDDDIEAANLRL